MLGCWLVQFSAVARIRRSSCDGYSALGPRGNSKETTGECSVSWIECLEGRGFMEQLCHKNQRVEQKISNWKRDGGAQSYRFPEEAAFRDRPASLTMHSGFGVTDTRQELAAPTVLPFPIPFPQLAGAQHHRHEGSHQEPFRTSFCANPSGNQKARPQGYNIYPWVRLAGHRWYQS